MRLIHISTLSVAALACVALAASPASARATRAQEEIHQVMVQGGPGSEDRYHLVEEWSTPTQYRRIVRDQRRGGQVILEELADARTGRSVMVDFRRGVRRDTPCGGKQVVRIHREIIPSVYPDKIKTGEMTIVARRTEFGRPVLDITGDIGEPDVGPQQIDLTIDEETGLPLHTRTGRGGRARTTVFELRRRSAAELARHFRLSKAGQEVEAKPTFCTR